MSQVASVSSNIWKKWLNISFQMLLFQGETVLHSWNIEDIIWYLGHESKRNPPSRWTITFIEIKTHPVRTKHSSYFGNIIVWSDASLRATWLSAMLKSRYPNNLAPPPNLLSF